MKSKKSVLFYTAFIKNCALYIHIFVTQKFIFNLKLKMYKSPLFFYESFF